MATSVAVMPAVTSSMTISASVTSLEPSVVVSNFKDLLLRNIVPCDELLTRLVNSNLLLPTVAAEIKALSTIEEKNSKLLGVLSLRGGNWLELLSDALQLSGHSLLADTIRDELSGASLILLNGNEIFKRFPKLNKFLQDVEKNELLEFLIKKIREEGLRQSWKRDVKALDKQKALQAKQMQLEEAMKHSEIIKHKNDTISGLQEQIDKLKRDILERESRLQLLSQDAHRVQTKHSQQLDTQMHFNMANDKTIRRMTDREIQSNKILKDMTMAMEQTLETYGNARKSSSHSRHLPSRSSHGNDVDYNIYPIDFAKTVLEKLITLVEKLATFKEKYESLYKERLHIMLLLDVTSQNPDEVNLTERVSSKLKELREKIIILNEEFQTFKLHEEDKENKSMDEQTQLINGLNSEIKLKETLLKKITDENLKMKSQVADLKTRFAILQQQHKEKAANAKKISRPPTPYQVLLQAELDSHAGEDIDSNNDKSTIITTVKFIDAGPTPILASKDKVNQSGLNLPPLNKAEFKLTAGRSTGHNYYSRGGNTKATHSMTTGATHISRNSIVAESAPSGLSYKPGSKTQNLLQISAFNANKPLAGNQYGIQQSYSKQQSIEIKRQATFFDSFSLK